MVCQYMVLFTTFKILKLLIGSAACIKKPKKRGITYILLVMLTMKAMNSSTV